MVLEFYCLQILYKYRPHNLMFSVPLLKAVKLEHQPTLIFHCYSEITVYAIIWGESPCLKKMRLDLGQIGVKKDEGIEQEDKVVQRQTRKGQGQVRSGGNYVLPRACVSMLTLHISQEKSVFNIEGGRRRIFLRSIGKQQQLRSGRRGRALENFLGYQSCQETEVVGRAWCVRKEVSHCLSLKTTAIFCLCFDGYFQTGCFAVISN